jgi:hypothetical protein
LAIYAAFSRRATILDAPPDLRIAPTKHVAPVLFNADDTYAPIGYRLVLGLLFILGCYVCAIALGVLGGISWMNGWNGSARTMIGAATFLASVGAIGNTIGLPWLWDSIG